MTSSMLHVVLMPENQFFVSRQCVMELIFNLMDAVNYLSPSNVGNSPRLQIAILLWVMLQDVTHCSLP